MPTGSRGSRIRRRTSWRACSGSRRWRRRSPTASTWSGLRRGVAARSAICSARARRRPAGPARVEDLERLCADVEQALRCIAFFKTRDVDGVMRTVREVMHRTPLDEREVKLLRAMAIEVVKYAERLARSGIHVDR